MVFSLKVILLEESHEKILKNCISKGKHYCKLLFNFLINSEQSFILFYPFSFTLLIIISIRNRMIATITNGQLKLISLRSVRTAWLLICSIIASISFESNIVPPVIITRLSSWGFIPIFIYSVG